MDAMEAIALAAGAGFAIVVVATVLVIIGVSHEERHGTLTSRQPPSVPALLARLLLRTYVRLPMEEGDESASCPDHECPEAHGHSERDI